MRRHALIWLAAILAPAVVAFAQLGNTKILLASNVDGDWDIYVVDYGAYLIDPGSATPTNLTNDWVNPSLTPSDEYDPGWSPDGGRIVFESDQDGDRDIYTADIGAANALTNVFNVTQATDAGGAIDRQADWSPDGLEIVFASDRTGGFELYRVDVGGVAVTSVPNTSGARGPAWSPDGGQIAFANGPYVYRIDADGANLTQLSFNGGGDEEPDWSADGSWVVFGRKAPGIKHLYVMDSALGESVDAAVRYTSTGYDEYPAWAPDMSRFTFYHDGDVVVADATPGATPELVFAGYQSTVPAWSPFLTSPGPVAGVFPRVLTFDESVQVGTLSSPREFSVTNVGDATLTVSDITSGNPQFTVTPTAFSLAPGISQAVSVTFAPTVVGWERATLSIVHDGAGTPTTVVVNGIGSMAVDAPPPGDLLTGSMIAFDSDRDADGDKEIFLISPDGGAVEQLTFNTVFDQQPAWSPTGDRLAFTRFETFDGHGNSDVYTMDAAGGDELRITTHSAIDYAAKWSPDGSKLVFVSLRDGNYEVYVTSAAGGEQVNLTNNPAHDDDPSWSPDGTRITFKSNRDGTYDIWMMDADGSDPVNLTDHSDDEAAPVWKPDGTQIAFQRRDGTAQTYGVYAMDWDPVTGAGVAVRVGDGETPTWSPDGTMIALWAPSNDIATVPAVGGTATPIAHAAIDRFPSWSPFLTPAVVAPAVTITSPTAGQEFPAGTTSVPLTPDILNHPAPGHWHWQLGAPFPDTGTATGTEVPAGTPTATITGLADGQTYTVYVALVDDASTADALLDAVTYPTSRASVTFSVAPTPTVTIDTPTAGQVLTVGSTDTALTVTIADHPGLGYWGWQLDSGAGPGAMNPVYSGNTATVAPLVDGGSYTVTVSLLDDADAPLSPAVTAAVSFTVGTPPDAVTVTNAQGALAATVSVPVEIYDVNLLGVVGVAVSLTYRSDILTPTSDVSGTTAVTLGSSVVPASWTLEQTTEVVDATTGQLNFSMAGDFLFPLLGPGTLVDIAFDVTATAPGDPLGTTYPLQLTNVQLNEGLVSATPVHGSFVVLDIVYGDVTGNGAAGAYDAAWVLEHTANGLLTPPVETPFPIEATAPVWASLPLPHPDAHTVADVDGDTVVGALDASLILQKEVGLILLFPVESPAAAPIADAAGVPYRLVGLASSARPGGTISVSLDASAVAELYAGELRLDFDGSLLAPVDVSLRSSPDGRDMPRPLLIQRESEGQVAIVFASARPIGSEAALVVTFEASRAIHEPTESAIRATHLRLNRALVETDFVYPFRVEPYQNRLMANYPNPFNPETWIPFELAEDSDVTIRVYDLAGGRIRTLELGVLATGEYVGRDRAAYWDGANAQGERVASGVYVYELAAGDYRSMRRMVVMK